MESLLARFWETLVGRVEGPFAFRLILQPLTATVFAVRAAMSDVRAGRPLYGWALVTDPRGHTHVLKEAWGHIGRVFAFAVVIDWIYEIVVFRWIYPGQALIVATVLAVLPYVLARGLIHRILLRWQGYQAEAKSRL